MKNSIVKNTSAASLSDAAIVGKKKRGALRDTVLFLIFASLVFLVLYRRFIFGNAVYLYTDIGSDSTASSYPILVMLSRLFQEGNFSFYTLSSGLGSDTTATFLQYINPLKAFLLLFNRSTMPQGILLQLYLETIITAWAAYRYLLIVTKHVHASMAGGLLFAFCSYSVLWSQNLSYGVCVTMFALAMFALEAYLTKRSGMRFLALAGILALFLFTNYFFCYMTALFVIVYIPVRAVFLRESFRTAVFSFFTVGLGAVFAAAMSAAAVVAITGSFMGSVRTGDASRPLLTFLKKGIDPRMVFACAARLFSENMAGIGDEYRGPDNYYEIAALSLGALFFFAFFYMLYLKKTRLKVLLVSAAAFLALILPVLRYILNLNWLVMRFSYWISFLMCLLIALFLKEVLSDFDPKALLLGVLTALCASGALLGLLFLLSGKMDFTLSVRTACFSAAFIAVYGIVLLLVRKRILPHFCLPYLFLILIAGEILIMRHDTLYLRIYLTKEQFGSSAYSDTTDRAVQDIAAADQDLYRIASTENPFYANEGLVDGFNGTTLYNNTNPASLRSLALSYGTNEVSTPYFLSGYPQYWQFTYLAGRYLIREEKKGEPVTEPALFERIASYENRDGVTETVVYRNKNALPFGYLLKEEIPEETYLAADLDGRMKLLAESWYLTGGSAGTDGENTENTENTENAEAADDSPGAADDSTKAGEESSGPDDGDTVIDLTESAVWKNPHNLEMTRSKHGTVFTATGDDPYIYVLIDTSKETADSSDYLRLKVRTGNKTVMRNIALYYLSEETPEPTQEWISTIFYNKYYPESLTLLPDGITGFRFDIDDDVDSVTVEALELVRCDHPEEHLTALKSSPVTDISFSRDLYQADLVSDTQDAVLCVPFLYSAGWKAEVNGEETEVLNINGGLTGVRVGKGSSHVELRYVLPHFRLGVLISLVSTGLYLAAWLVLLVKETRRKRQK